MNQTSPQMSMCTGVYVPDFTRTGGDNRKREGIENEIVAKATATVSIGYSDCFHRYLT